MVGGVGEREEASDRVTVRTLQQLSSSPAKSQFVEWSSGLPVQLANSIRCSPRHFEVRTSQFKVSTDGGRCSEAGAE